MTATVKTVLILVLVEHTLGDEGDDSRTGKRHGLNPCFSGTYSRSLNAKQKYLVILVLILVLVEHTLGEAEVLSNFARLSES